MEDQNSINPQTPPAATPPTSTGISVEELQAEREELRKQREGLLRDLQREREKRQELEARQSSPAPSAANPDVTDELGKVITPYVAPALKEIQSLKDELANEKALNYLSTKTGKSVEAILEDKDLQTRLVSTARKWGLAGNSYEVSKRALELMELEDMKHQEAERKRAASTSQNQTLPSGAPPAPVSSGREYSADEFNRMAPAEFDALSAKGSFRKVDGKFVYSPR